MASMNAKLSLKVMLLLAVTVAACALSVTNNTPSTIRVNNVPIVPNATVNIGPLPATGVLNITTATGKSAIIVVPQLTRTITIAASSLFGIAYGLLNQIIGVIPVPV